MNGVCRYLVLAWVSIGLAGCTQGTTQEPILIGHFAPQSGPDQVLGDHARQGVQLALAKLNQEGGIRGRPLAVLQPAYAPEESDVLPAITVRLITLDRVVALLGGPDPKAAERIARAAQPYDVPFVTAAELPASTFSEQTFSLAVSPNREGAVLARTVADEFKADRVALVVDRRQTAAGARADSFRKRFLQGDKHSLEELPFKEEGELDGIAKTLAQGPGRPILFLGLATDFLHLRAKLQGGGSKDPLLLAGDAEHAGLLTNQPASDVPSYYLTCYFPEADTPEARVFCSDFRKHSGGKPDLAAAQAYDGTFLLAEALRQAKALTPAKVRAALAAFATTPLAGLGGPITFDRDHSARRSLFLVRSEIGKNTLVRRYDGDTP